MTALLGAAAKRRASTETDSRGSAYDAKTVRLVMSIDCSWSRAPTATSCWAAQSMMDLGYRSGLPSGDALGLAGDRTSCRSWTEDRVELLVQLRGPLKAMLASTSSCAFPDRDDAPRWAAGRSVRPCLAVGQFVSVSVTQAEAVPCSNTLIFSIAVQLLLCGVPSVVDQFFAMEAVPPRRGPIRAPSAKGVPEPTMLNMSDDDRASLPLRHVRQRARRAPGHSRSRSGLPAGANRRVPWLRREEVAMLAGISAPTTTCGWSAAPRARQPSPQVPRIARAGPAAP